MRTGGDTYVREPDQPAYWKLPFVVTKTGKHVILRLDKPRVTVARPGHVHAQCDRCDAVHFDVTPERATASASACCAPPQSRAALLAWLEEDRRVEAMGRLEEFRGQRRAQRRSRHLVATVTQRRRVA